MPPRAAVNLVLRRCGGWWGYELFSQTSVSLHDAGPVVIACKIRGSYINGSQHLPSGVPRPHALNALLCPRGSSKRHKSADDGRASRPRIPAVRWPTLALFCRGLAPARFCGSRAGPRFSRPFRAGLDPRSGRRAHPTRPRRRRTGHWDVYCGGLC